MASKIGNAMNNLVLKNIKNVEEYNFRIARFIANVALRADQKNIVTTAHTTLFLIFRNRPLRKLRLSILISKSHSNKYRKHR